MATVEEEAAWEALPAHEHRSVWNETERNFWVEQERLNEAADNEAEKHFQTTITDAKVELSHLTGRRSLLAESQQRLARELAKVEEELATVSQACDEKAERLNQAEQEYRDGQQARLENRRKIRKTMRKFFKEKRGEDPNGVDPEDLEIDAVASASDSFSTRPRVNGIAPERNGVVEHRGPREPREVAESTTDEDTRMEGIELTNGDRAPSDKSSVDVMVNVIDADGTVIGPVERIEPWNQWVEAIQDLEIRREVKIRRGRRFNDAHLASIYERTEAKGVKWLSCMIQATGSIQTKRCQSCDKNQGAFDDCIIVGGDLFQKCGNCEWNRQGCHGASGDFIDIPAARRRYRRRDTQTTQDSSPTQREHPMGDIHVRPEYDYAPPPERQAPLLPPPPPISSSLLPILAPQPPHPHPHPHPHSHPHPLHPPHVDRDRAHPSTEMETPVKDVSIMMNGSHLVREPEQMPTPQEYRITPGFTPANVNARSRPPSADRPTPTSMHIEPSPQPTESFSDDVEEITRDTLALRHNGSVYTFPDCVEAVPLEKIDERHPYWEPNWPNVRTLIEPQLAKWREKHAAAIEAGPKQERGGSSKYQIGRQVNRGIKILEFLEEGDISPYQLLSKKYISSGKGGICSYDTLFRLSETMSELAKFKLDIKPVEWMRQRLYELIQIEGASFNLPRTIHDFYHDPKLTALRYKHGYKNIGRPSGMKSGRHSLGSPNHTPKPLKKRKSMHSLASTPRDTPYLDQSPLATQMALPPDSPYAIHKRTKLHSPPMGMRDEFATHDHSDADSWSGVPIRRSDYRLHQVKTRHYTSSTHVTQYWTWIDDDMSFEHQVLKGLHPVSWGLHKDPIDFHLNMEEIAEVVWNIEALRIHVIMRTEGSVLSKKDGRLRGDIMAAFKRERTLRRFLNFCRERGVRMLKQSTEELDRRWASMQSEQLPDENGKPSKDLMA